MILRDDREVALNEVVVAIKAAADDYEDAADLVYPGGLQDLFRGLVARRRRHAAAVEEEIRRLGDLPRDPDADLESLRQLIRHLKAGLSAEERLTLVEECEAREQEIADRIGVALELDLAERARQVLQDLDGDVADALASLAAQKSRAAD